jgi:DNA-binding transcriptional MerR regulator
VAETNETIGAGAAAREAGVSAEYLRYLARVGRVPFEMTPYGRVYRPADIARLKAEREAAKREPVAA